MKFALITATAALAALAMITTAGTAAFDLTVNGANAAPAPKRSFDPRAIVDPRDSCPHGGCSNAHE